MTLHDGFDRTVSDWLAAEAGQGTPAYLDEVLARTTRTRQRPAWSSLERWLPVQTTLRLSPLPRLAWLALVAVLAIALVAAILFVASRPRRVPPPFGPAANGLIGYWAGGDILVADPDGSHPHPVVTGPTQDFAPLYSRDGSTMAFWRAASEHEWMLMLATIDGSNLRAVLPSTLTDPDWFEWSPDDRSLAVVHTVKAERVLSIVDVAQGTIRTLDLGGLPVDNSVFWRPNTSSELVFTSHAGSGDQTHAGIYSIQSDGSRRTTLVPPVVRVADYLDLDLAPDGRSLTYWRFQQGTGSRIHRVDLSSGNDQEVMFDPTAKGETGLLHSPDGARVIFQREDTMAQLMIAPSDASRPGILVGPRFPLDAGFGYGFSPDGQTVFLMRSGQAPQFFDVATGAARTGPSAPGECCAWQRLAP